MHWNVSCTSADLSVETIRIPCSGSVVRRMNEVTLYVESGQYWDGVT